MLELSLRQGEQAEFRITGSWMAPRHWNKFMATEDLAYTAIQATLLLYTRATTAIIIYK